MHTVVGPVVVTGDGGFGFDLWTLEEGLSRGFSYRRIEDAYYARKVEIRSRTKSLARPMLACSTVDEFASALAEPQIPRHALGGVQRTTQFDLTDRAESGWGSRR
jgi:hypothetical protein